MLIPEEVASGVFTVAAGDHRTAFVVGSGGVVALNSFGSRDRAQSYRQAIADAAGGAEPEIVVATIDHLDHTGATADFAPRAEIVAHELCARVIEGRGAPSQRLPQRPIRGGGEELELGGTRLALRYLGPTQGTGNLAVHLPEHRVLFLAGPRGDARYGLLPDFHLRHVTRIWREIAALDVDVVIPARGRLMTTAELVRAADYLDAVKRACQEGFAAGLPIWEIETLGPFVSDRLREGFGDLPGFDRHIGITSIRVVHHYLMGGWGMEDTAEPDALLEPSAPQ